MKMNFKVSSILPALTLIAASLPAHAVRVRVGACQAYCENKLIVRQKSADPNEVFRQLQSACPDTLRAQPGQWVTAQVYDGTQTIDTYGRSIGWGGGRTYTHTERPLYKEQTYWEPGPAATPTQNCIEQDLDTDMPQTHVGYYELQG